MSADSKDIRFIDSEYHPLFIVPDGASIILTDLDGTSSSLPCQYIDECHARIGDGIFHIHQFAELQEQRGAVYAPEQPGETDICDTYEVYQIKDLAGTPYGFRPYAAAKDKLRPSDYVKVYAGVLAPGVTLDDIYVKHNQDQRPRRMEIRSMSVSDVVVLTQNGSRRAFYVDSFGFKEANEFLGKVPQRKRPSQKRGKGGESR